MLNEEKIKMLENESSSLYRGGEAYVTVEVDECDPGGALDRVVRYTGNYVIHLIYISPGGWFVKNRIFHRIIGSVSTID